jgi:outer membrane receptor protein involved in Fe transport
MSNYEGFRLRQQGQELASVPTQAMRNGDLSAFPAGTVTNVLNNNAPFAGNIIPSGLIAPQATKLLQYDPLPNTGSGYVNNYLEQNNNFTNKDQFTQRIDFVESAKSSWFGRYSFQNETKLGAGYFSEAGEVTDRVKQAMLSNTRVISPSLVNEFHFGTAIYHNILSTPNAFVNNVTPQLGIPLLEPVPPSGWGIPSVGATPFTTFGDSIQGPWEADDSTFQWADSLSWVHGSHSFKFGAEIRRDRYNETGNQGIRGNYTFQCPCTDGSPFADLLTGYPFRNSESAGVAISQFRKTSQFYYATDSWKVRSNFTVDIGLRYEFVPAWTSRTPDFTSVEIPQPWVYFPNDPRTGVIPGFTTPTVTGVPLQNHAYLARDCAAYGQNSFYPPGVLVRFNPLISTQCVSGQGTTLTPNDHKDFAPRIGLAWSPTPKTTVRAGFGFFYAQDMGNAFFDAVKNFFTQVTPVTSRILGDPSNLTYDNPLGFGGANPCGTVQPYVCISTPVLFMNDPNRRTPYIVQQTFNIQRQLTNTMAFEVGYLGSEGHRLEAHLSYNNVVPGPGSVASRSPYPEMVNVLPTLSDAQSNYQSLGVKFTRRLANGLSALLGYTYAKNMDDMTAINPAAGLFAGYGSTRQPETGWCIKCEYALSDYNQAHRFVASVLYELPIGKGKQYLNHGIGALVLGGWQLNSIFTKGSGFPTQTLLGSNQSQSNSNSDRPDYVLGQPVVLPHPTNSQWVNPAAFVRQPLYLFGNEGRNRVIGPPVATWDFSTFKNFNFTETKFLQFRFECFNCANHPVFGDPGQSMALDQLNAAGQVIPGTGNFGVITSTRAGIDMRELQFSLKLVF